MIRRYLVKADTVSKVGVLLRKKIGVFLLQSAVVHDVLRVANHVRDHICLKFMYIRNAWLSSHMYEPFLHVKYGSGII